MSPIATESRILVVGGHSRSVGKTSLVVDLIRAFPEANWTAVKITQYGHGVCSRNGESCGCAPDEHAFSLDEEHDRSDRSDTSRFLTAGAARSLWLRTKQGQLGEGMPLLRAALEGAKNAILESNTVLQFLRPSLYLVVLDPAQEDFKTSARIGLDRADAFILRSPLTATAWQDISLRFVEKKPQFLQSHGEPLPAAVFAFVRDNFFKSFTVSRS